MSLTPEPYSHDAAIQAALDEWHKDVDPEDWFEPLGTEEQAMARAVDAVLRYLAQCAPVEAGPEPGNKPPWEVEHDRNGQANVYTEGSRDHWIALLPHQCVVPIEAEQEKNAAAIVHCVSAFPLALAQLTAARAEVERLRRGDEGGTR